MGRTHRDYCGRTKIKEIIRKTISMLVNNIKMVLGEIGWGDVD
jgi:hypothetical protein